VAPGDAGPLSSIEDIDDNATTTWSRRMRIVHFRRSDTDPSTACRSVFERYRHNQWTSHPDDVDCKRCL
jgi:hypothetical protein